MMDTSPTDDLAMALFAADSAARDSYQRQAPFLIAYADQQMAERTDIGDLLGACPLEVLYHNHAEHIRFMAAHLELKSVDTFIAKLTWIYHSHRLHGIDLRAIPIDLAIWREGVERYLEPRSAAPIAAVYRCLIELHPLLLLLAHAPPGQPGMVDELQPHFQRYLHALLVPDTRAALRATDEYIIAPERIATWWEEVIRPTMYEIGHRWARGEISVGQEHMATAITQRVIAHYYPQILDLPHDRGRIVVASSPGEFHELGSRIVSDLLEIDGWDTYYTGANTPAESVISLLAQSQARILCISTTLSESLPAVAALIAQIRSADLSHPPRILVGGQAYLSDPGIWRQVGADWFAHSAREGIQFINSLHQ